VQVARCLQTLPELMMDWLENFSLVEFEDVLVATYFVTSSKTKQSLILRVSAVPDSPTTRVQFSSVRSVWPMAEPMEKEAEDLFGIIFKKEPDASGFVPEQETRSHLLPENWVGFPLRKGYVFPTEVYGLSHSSKNKRDLDKEVVPQ
jgi:NADH-quinone oxidoreductase subunit C